MNFPVDEATAQLSVFKWVALITTIIVLILVILVIYITAGHFTKPSDVGGGGQ